MIEIINKDKLEPYIYKRVPKPTMTPKETGLYWGRELERIKYGYQNGDTFLPGTFYFLVQHITLVDRNEGFPIIPDAREGSLRLHQAWAENCANNRHTGVIKGRGFGLSAEGGAMANYYAITSPGSNSLITNKDQKGISQFFRAKVIEPYTRLDMDLASHKRRVNGKDQETNPYAPIQEIAKNSTQKEAYLRIGVKYKNPFTGEPDYGESQMICYETSQRVQSATAFSGLGGKFGFFDELPLHTRKKDLLYSSRECFRDPASGVFKGFLLWGGTCEDTLTEKDLAEFKTLIEKKDLIDTNILFMPYYMGKFLDKYGRPQIKIAKEWRDMEIEKAMKDPSGDALRKFIKNNPETLEEVLELGTGADWDQDVKELIQKQEKIVLASNIAHKPVSFEADSVGTVHAIIKPGSNTTITEDPKMGIEYTCLIDGTSTGSVFGASEGSKLSAQIVKGYDPVGRSYDVVCEYLERPKKLDEAFAHIIRMCDFYSQRSGKFQGIEAEAAQGMEEWMATTLINHHREGWITYRQDFSKKGWVDKSKVFQPITVPTRNYMYGQANTFFKKWIQGLTRLTVIQELLRPRADETFCHSRSAYLLLFIKYPLINEVEKSVSNKAKQTLIKTINAQGVMESKVVTISSPGSGGRGRGSLKFGPR